MEYNIDGAEVERSASRNSEHETLQEELERMLAHPLFCKSKRYPAFLRYILQHSYGEKLTEKAIGIALFDRKPDYDTDADPIVRVTAGEVRKRISEYYETDGRSSNFRIQIPPGSYAAVVMSSAIRETRPLPPSAGLVVEPLASPSLSGSNRIMGRTAFFSAICAGVILTVIIMVWAPWKSQTALDRFWNPVLKSNGPAIVCLPNNGAIRLKSAAPVRATWLDPITGLEETMTQTADQLMQGTVSTSSAKTVAYLTAFLASRGKPIVVRDAPGTSLSDFQAGPGVLVGAYTNQWTLRLMNTGRFHFGRDGPIAFIKDAKNSDSRAFVTGQNLQDGIGQDYGLASRVTEPATGRVFVLAGGLLAGGTTAAADFVTNEDYMESAARNWPKGWEQKNIQVVVSTRVINGSSGRPVPVATYFW